MKFIQFFVFGTEVLVRYNENYRDSRETNATFFMWSPEHRWVTFLCHMWYVSFTKWSGCCTAAVSIQRAKCRPWWCRLAVSYVNQPTTSRLSATTVGSINAAICSHHSSHSIRKTWWDRGCSTQYPEKLGADRKSTNNSDFEICFGTI